MIETRQLQKKIGNVTVVDALNLQVEPGDILGFLGPSGAGKTTTVKMLTCMVPPTSGSAAVAGFDVVKDSLEVRKRIGYVPENGILYETLSAKEYLDMVTKLHHMDSDYADMRIEELLRLFELLDDQHKYLNEFSKGMKQKVVIISALLSNPKVLFLDEPLNGLDADSTLVTKELLQQMAEKGRTILFCSHLLDVVEKICTRIVVINHGKIVTEGTAEDIIQETERENLEEAFAKLTSVRDPHRISQDILSVLE